MLHRVKGVVTLAELRATIGQHGNVGGRLQSLAVTIEADERDAGTGRRGSKHEPTGLAQVKADAVNSRFAGNRSSTGIHSRSASSRSSRLIMPASLNNAADARNDSR